MDKKHRVILGVVVVGVLVIGLIVGAAISGAGVWDRFRSMSLPSKGAAIPGMTPALKTTPGESDTSKCPTLQVVLKNRDLRDAGGDYSGIHDGPVMAILPTTDNVFVLDKLASGWVANTLNANVETDEIYIVTNTTTPGGVFDVFYVDATNDVTYAGEVTQTAGNTQDPSPYFAYMEVEDTKCYLWSQYWKQK